MGTMTPAQNAARDVVSLGECRRGFRSLRVGSVKSRFRIGVSFPARGSVLTAAPASLTRTFGNSSRMTAPGSSIGDAVALRRSATCSLTIHNPEGRLLRYG